MYQMILVIILDLSCSVCDVGRGVFFVLFLYHFILATFLNLSVYILNLRLSVF